MRSEVSESCRIGEVAVVVEVEVEVEAGAADVEESGATRVWTESSAVAVVVDRV